MRPLFYLCAAIAFALAQPAMAQPYPSKPIRMIVPFGAGSGTDQVARALAQAIGKADNVTVVVDNRPGGNGFIAAQAVSNAEPDGYTMLLTTNSTHAAAEHLYKNLPYDPVKDFTPVALLRKGYLVMVTQPDFPAATVAEFTARAKRDPGVLNFGSGSSSSRVSAELYKQLSGVDIVHVPYKSNPNALTDLMGGQIQVMFVDTSSAVSLVKNGKLRGLAVSSTKRLDILPMLPTMEEAGLKGYEMSYWTAAYLPRNTSPHIATRLGELLKQAMNSPELKQLMEKTGTEVAFGDGEMLKQFQASETEKWARIIKAAGIQPE
ncbi:tripartite tricarboxylate transporter substrate binding protein [Candidimonas sp. SYP-B2681]|uniref:Bug family tripartite tricarboxylate transporter substrate binding protein n=1 Tax=Candidimonas sp. SYP-B2681 TaxID=2497686 RepID=UPI000F88FEEE|nr:tripartite tricarboxylate transporter substrate binding protein [Candidimonas sp. SYP-B2681]RTZ48212.1 tripartite tricarboxylate transporter substrate binding protein [Candidimonas sp. SYP-B2681]